MRQITIILLALILATTMVFASELRVNLIDYQPKPVSAGNYFTINFKARNIASVNLTNVDFKLRSNEDFSISSNDEISLDILHGGEEVTLSWTVLARKNARAGFRPLTLDANGLDLPYTIQIKSLEPTISISNVQTYPEQIIPGSTASVKIDIQNKASFNIKNLRVKLDLSSKDLPFAPSESVTEQVIEELSGDSKTSLNFKVVSTPEAQPNIYKVPLALEYFDEFGEKYSTTTLLSLKVGSIPKLEVSTEKQLLIAGKKSTVGIKVVNSGLSPVKFLNVLFKSSADLNVLSSSSAYIGDLDSDDYQTIDVDLFTNNEGQVILPLTISFLDANNQQYTQELFLALTSYYEEEAQNLGLLSKSNSKTIALVVLVLVGLFVLYRVVRKLKRK